MQYRLSPNNWGQIPINTVVIPGQDRESTGVWIPVCARMTNAHHSRPAVIPARPAVIPAKAGIQGVMDPRMREDDGVG